MKRYIALAAVLLLAACPPPDRDDPPPPPPPDTVAVDTVAVDSARPRPPGWDDFDIEIAFIDPRSLQGLRGSGMRLALADTTQMRVKVRYRVPVPADIDTYGDIDSVVTRLDANSNDGINESREAKGLPNPRTGVDSLIIRYQAPAPGATFSGFVCMASKRRQTFSVDRCKTVTWTRPDAPPPPPDWDTVDVTSLNISVPTYTQAMYEKSAPVCYWVGFGTRYALPARERSSGCGPQFDSLPAERRGVSASHQSIADTLCVRWYTRKNTLVAATCNIVASGAMPRADSFLTPAPVFSRVYLASSRHEHQPDIRVCGLAVAADTTWYLIPKSDEVQMCRQWATAVANLWNINSATTTLPGLSNNSLSPATVIFGPKMRDAILKSSGVGDQWYGTAGTVCPSPWYYQRTGTSTSKRPATCPPLSSYN